MHATQRQIDALVLPDRHLLVVAGHDVRQFVQQDRFHLCEDVIDRLPQLGSKGAYFKQALHDKLIEHKEYIQKHGDDLPAISGWKWGQAKGAASSPGASAHSTTTEGDNV